MRLTLDDAAFANTIMGHDAVYPFVADDHTNPDHRYIAAEFVLANPLICMLSPNEHTLFMALPRTMTMYDVHTMILPAGRGRQAVQSGREAARWMFENTACEKLVSFIPVDNPQALLYSRLVGFKQEGVVTKSWKKHGQLLDQILVGLEKETLCPHSQP